MLYQFGIFEQQNSSFCTALFEVILNKDKLEYFIERRSKKLRS